MEIALVGIVSGLLAKSVGQLAWVAAGCGFLLHALPRTYKSLRDIAAIRSAPVAELLEAKAAGINVNAATRLTVPYAIIVHSVVGIVGTMVVALVVYGVRGLFP